MVSLRPAFSRTGPARRPGAVDDARGMRCVAVPNPVTRHLKMPETELVAESLESLSLAGILNRV